MRDGGTPIPVSIDSADMGDAEVFRVDHEGNKIILNSSLTTAGSSASSLESDIVRTLFFLLLAPDAIKKSQSAKVAARHSEINEILALVLRDG